MTVIELRDVLDKYIKTDPPGLWQLNDVEADAENYRTRCKERENAKIVVDIKGDGSTPVEVKAAYGNHSYLNSNEKDIFTLFLN